MAFCHCFVFFFFCALGRAIQGMEHSDLKLGYYSSSCPNAEATVKQTLMNLLLQDPTAGAALLRLAFHDCDVMGCDASILLDSTPRSRSEMESPKNFGIRRADFIDRIKAAVEGVCPHTVSCADIIALAARDSIQLAGGPSIPIPTGRKDSRRSNFLVADTKLATATSSVDAILKDFQTMGITTGESVALLGAHTLGVGHCLSLLNRLYPTVDSSMDTMYSVALRVLCPSPKYYLNLTAIPNDSTMFRFDNMFFKDAAMKRILFSLDAAVQSDPRTSGFTSRFARNQSLFFETFSRGFLKLTSTVNPEGGEVRRNCRVANS